MINTEKLYAEIAAKFNGVIPAYFADAELPADAIYCVINSPVHTDIADRGGDLVFFYVDIFGDDRAADNNAALQRACDSLRNTLDAEIISAPGYFAGHLNFEKSIDAQESEFDINHRRQEWTARVFCEWEG